ncbi:MAG: hypothetical protein IKL89_02725 [Clostridia bacterium]|nr:hypothetical protein [Clostridia bacterium]
MTPAETHAFIAQARALGSRPGLTRVRALMAALHNPAEGLRIIHITGTNGKGSCAALLYAGLCGAGLTAGLFTSPEIFRVNERISACGEQISEAELCAAAAEVYPHWQTLAAAGDPPTEFEIFVAMALVHFRRRGVTHAVIEVGMGGRGDATNVFSSTDVCVITPISLDHTNFLGNSVSALAEEKCGILRPGCTVVTPADQHPEALSVIRREAARLGCELRLADPAEARDVRLFADRTEFSLRGTSVTVPFGGDFQVQNGVCAAEALAAFGRRCGLSLSVDGFAAARLCGRFCRVSDRPEIWCDAGHNPAAVTALCAAISRHLSDRPLMAVMGMYRDKDHAFCIRQIAGRCTAFFAVESDNPRALSAETVAAEAREVCPAVYVTPDPAEGLRAAVAEAEKVGGRVLICGSFGHMARALEGIL